MGFALFTFHFSPVTFAPLSPGIRRSPYFAVPMIGVQEVRGLRPTHQSAPPDQDEST
jgi:hypothetical protein